MRVHLDVELELGGATIHGTVDDAAGPPVAFSGWLELMSAFEIVCARVTATAARAGDPPGG
jgi:hypothetical protein